MRYDTRFGAKRIVLVVVLATLLVAGIGAGIELFAPERATTVDNTGTLGPDAETLATGEFVGKAGHAVSGTVSLVRDGDAYFLYFQEYRQTQGPDVFVYVTPAADPDTTAEVAAGQRVLVDGGADGGESTKEGTFVQRLPDDFDPAGVNGVAIWCDRFSVPFGAASLERSA